MTSWGSIYKPHGESSRCGAKPSFLLLTGRVSRPDRMHPVLIRAVSGHLCQAHVFVILRLAWFLSSCLDFAWFLGSSIVFLGSCLRCWSSDHHVAFVQVTFATYWTTKLTLVSALVQTPKSKVNEPRVHFSYNLPLFGDWWQHDQSKQIIKVLEFFKNYLLARMQCKGKFIWSQR
jgi:hypothetical protein